MSGYRTLHRIPTQTPIYRVHFSPCRPPSNDGSLRLVTAGPSNQIHVYSLRERTSSGELDATPLVVETVECLVPSDFVAPEDKCTLGYGALDITRNYIGTDPLAGHEVIAASQLGGRVSIWVRLDPASHAGKEFDTSNNIASSSSLDGVRYITPDVEFDTPATGTTLAIRPPSLGLYYSQYETDILLAVGCADGSVLLLQSGILAYYKQNQSSSSGRIVGDASSSNHQSQVVINVKSTNRPGEVVATIGRGHACVMSIAWHPSIPNTFAVGRKDGSMDIYSSTSSSTEDGNALNFRRMHRLSDSTRPLRGLTFSQPQGMLLFAGDDSGKIYQYDTSVATCNFAEFSDSKRASSAPIKLVAFALSAHKGWIMNLTSFEDEKRIVSCGSDRSVKVWDCGMGFGSSMAVHSFDGVHGGYVWDVAVGCVGGEDGKKKKSLLVSCGNDGVVQVYSCGD
ncbi:hypothetical protein ACHAWO_006164 [Cyclotella atomus]|uniref:WD40 repeat-like protein n=1 Tax=Cyclotella atomus TaxID=382360 RepID=A0ABD3PLM0_9STRA